MSTKIHGDAENTNFPGEEEDEKKINITHRTEWTQSNEGFFKIII